MEAKRDPLRKVTLFAVFFSLVKGSEKEAGAALDIPGVKVKRRERERASERARAGRQAFLPPPAADRTGPDPYLLLLLLLPGTLAFTHSRTPS